MRAHSSVLGIDEDTLHRRQVDHDPAIDGRASGHVVAAAANRYLEAKAAGEINRTHNVAHALAPGDQCRPLVDQSVVDFACILVAGVCGFEELPSKDGGKLGCGVCKGCDR